VSPTGTGTTCASDAKCLLATAIGVALPGRNIILLDPATYLGGVTIDHPVQIVGSNATLEAASGAAVTVTNNVAAELDFASIMGAAIGISCTSGATLRAHGVSVTNNQQGITSACALTLERSSVSSNSDGALEITGGSIDIHDNFIVHNGSDTARVASVAIADGVTGSFAFNTVAYNNARQNADPGVDCNAAAVTGAGNLVTDNMHKGVFDGSPQVSGACDLAGSYTAPGTGNNDLHWVDVNAADVGFHLTVDSTAVLDKLDKLACAASEDFDGDPRPIGDGCDYGADERKP
jgi:hypothetical protein